jgi:GTP-binding protein EngB required for normal cell division
MLLNLINLPDDGFNKIIEVVPAEQWTDLIIKYFKYKITIAQTINAVDKIKEQKEEEKSEQPINVLADNKVEEIIQEATEQVKAEESNGDI